MALTNAERQARYRERHRASQRPPRAVTPTALVTPPRLKQSRSQAKPFTVRHFREWARRLELDNGNQWETEPFQEAFVEDLFSGIPECWLIIPEGNAKTTLFAGLALYHIEHRRSAMVPVAASARDQAQIMYQQAEGFVERSELRGFKLHPGYRRVRFADTLSMIQFQAADDRTGDGVIPTMALLDELHRHRDLRLYRTWRGKLLKRNGQIGAISTRGEPGSEFELAIEQMLMDASDVSVSGAFTRAASPRFVLHQWAVGDDGDAENMEAVKAANPLKSITIDDLTEKRAAPTMTSYHWLRFVCNRPTLNDDAWLGPEGAKLWESLEQPYELVPGARSWVGVDVALKHDTTAVVIVQRRDDGKSDDPIRYHAECRIFFPSDDRPIDVTDVMKHVRDLAAKYDVEAVSYDPRFFDVPAKMLSDEGLPLFEVPQSVDRMTAACGSLYEAIHRGQITHNADHAFGVQVLGAAPRFSDRGFTLAKGKSRGKIDAAIALALAYDQALRHETDGPSAYEERGMLAV